MPLLPAALTAWSGVARSLVIYYGQPWKLRRMRALSSRWLGPGAVAFDVGAHVGNRIRVWRSLGARVIACEPQPAFARFLAWRYGGDADVVLVEQAVADTPGEATLHISDAAPTVSTLASDWMQEVRADHRFDAVQWNRTARVSVTTLDALIARYGLPAFCKIDVEGHEASVLRGLHQALPALSFEFLPVSVARAVACVERIEELARYRYNWSLGEQQRFGSERWVDADAIVAWLRSRDPLSSSGDIYAERADG